MLWSKARELEMVTVLEKPKTYKPDVMPEDDLMLCLRMN